MPQTPRLIASLPTLVLLLSRALVLAVPPLVAYALYIVFVRTPNERTMGIIQKVFYFHLPLALGCFLFFFIVAVASIVYLVKGSRMADMVAQSAAEMGVLDCVLVCVTGSLWARGSWGVYWTADVRLTTTLILLFLYSGYLILRSSSEQSAQARSFAAVVGILSFAAVPLVYFSVHIWNSIHPIVITEKGSGLAPEFARTLLLTLPVGIMAQVSVWLLRLELLLAEANLASLKAEISKREEEQHLLPSAPPARPS